MSNVNNTESRVERIEQDKAATEVVYFCNAAGDAFWYDAESKLKSAEYLYNDAAGWQLSDPHIPEVLRDAYNKAFSEDYGYPCYIMTVGGAPYFTLIAEFGDFCGNRSGELREKIVQNAEVLAQAEAIRNCSGCRILFPEDTNTPFCQWELFVCIPAESVTPAICRQISDAMTECLCQEADAW